MFYLCYFRIYGNLTYGKNILFLLRYFNSILFPLQMRTLNLVLKLLPEDSKESQTARILLYKLFYDQTDQGMTQFLLNLMRSFDSHKQPRRYSASHVPMEGCPHWRIFIFLCPCGYKNFSSCQWSCWFGWSYVHNRTADGETSRSWCNEGKKHRCVA